MAAQKEVDDAFAKQFGPPATFCKILQERHKTRPLFLPRTLSYRRSFRKRKRQASTSTSSKKKRSIVEKCSKFLKLRVLSCTESSYRTFRGRNPRASRTKLSQQVSVEMSHKQRELLRNGARVPVELSVIFKEECKEGVKDGSSAAVRYVVLKHYRLSVPLRLSRNRYKKNCKSVGSEILLPIDFGSYERSHDKYIPCFLSFRVAAEAEAESGKNVAVSPPLAQLPGEGVFDTFEEAIRALQHVEKDETGKLISPLAPSGGQLFHGRLGLSRMENPEDERASLSEGEYHLNLLRSKQSNCSGENQINLQPKQQSLGPLLDASRFNSQNGNESRILKSETIPLPLYKPFLRVLLEWTSADGSDLILNSKAKVSGEKEQMEKKNIWKDQSLVPCESEAAKNTIGGDGSILDALPVIFHYNFEVSKGKDDENENQLPNTQEREMIVLRKSEVRHNFRCPFCALNAGDIDGLICHLTTSHSKFYFRCRCAIRFDEFSSKVQNLNDSTKSRRENFQSLSSTRYNDNTNNTSKDSVKNIDDRNNSNPLRPVTEIHVNVRTGSWQVGSFKMTEEERSEENAYDEDKEKLSEKQLQTRKTRARQFSFLQPSAFLYASNGGRTKSIETTKQNDSYGASSPLDTNSINLLSKKWPDLNDILSAKTAEKNIEDNFGECQRGTREEPFFHSRNNAERLISEMDENFDSDEESDLRWVRTQSELMIDDFEDVTIDEKLFMKYWNRFSYAHPVHSDRKVPEACLRFCRIYAEKIRRFSLEKNVVLHLYNIWRHGLIDSESIAQCMKLLKK
eukprot:g2423.t1